MHRSLIFVALAFTALFAPAPAEAATWQRCGSISQLVNEGDNRATARISIRRDGAETINCATARSVARKVLRLGPAESLVIAGRLWDLDRGATHGTTFTYTTGPHAVVRVALSTRRA